MLALLIFCFFFSFSLACSVIRPFASAIVERSALDSFHFSLQICDLVVSFISFICWNHFGISFVAVLPSWTNSDVIVFVVKSSESNKKRATYKREKYIRPSILWTRATIDALSMCLYAFMCVCLYVKRRRKKMVSFLPHSFNAQSRFVVGGSHNVVAVLRFG